MGKMKEEISQLVKKSKGLNEAKNDSEQWIKNTGNSTGNKSVARTSEVFKPGKIYTFRYENPINKDRTWDRNPTVLSLGRIDGLDIGINLNYLTYKQRLTLLDRVYDQYYNRIQDSIKKSGGNALMQSEILALNYDNIKRFLSKGSYVKACRRYITSKRKNTIVVSYSEWARIAVIDNSDFTNGDINQAQEKTN